MLGLMWYERKNQKCSSISRIDKKAISAIESLLPLIKWIFALQLLQYEVTHAHSYTFLVILKKLNPNKFNEWKNPLSMKLQSRTIFYIKSRIKLFLPSGRTDNEMFTRPLGHVGERLFKRGKRERNNAIMYLCCIWSSYQVQEE